MYHSNSMLRNTRYSTLDLFRVCCAFIVCAFHTVVHLGCNYSIFQPLFRMGAMFMTAFFLLSGFTLYLNYSSINLTQLYHMKVFFSKRCLSILPLYYFAALLYVFFIGSESVSQNLLLIPTEIFALQSVFSSLFSVTHNGGTWFISCLMLCYLVYPFIQTVITQLSIKSKFRLVFFFAFILLYSPIVVIKFDTQNIYSNPFFRTLEFSIGVLLASLYKHFINHPISKHCICTWKTPVLSFLLLLAGVSLAFKLHIRPNDYMLYSWIGLPCFSILIYSMAGIKCRTLEKSALLHYLAKISYAFFLAQLYSNTICKKVISKFSISNNLIKIILGWTVCILIALILHELIEIRLLQPLRKKLLKKIS